MRKFIDKNDTYKNMLKVAKRIAITILCCIPVMVLFGYFTRNVIKSDALQVVCFMLIMGVAVLIEELIVRAKEKAKAEEAVVEPKKDVFK